MAGNGDNNNAMGIASAAQVLGDAVDAGFNKLRELTFQDGVETADQTVTRLGDAVQNLANRRATSAVSADNPNAPLPTMTTSTVPKEVYENDAKLLREAKAEIQALAQQGHAPTTGLATGN